MKTIILIAIALIACPATGQIVGETRGPSGCVPVIAAPPPLPKPMVSNVMSRCGTLTVDVYLLNDTYVPVPGHPELGDVVVRADGRSFHPRLVADGAATEIAPGAFAGPVRYKGALPEGLSGTGEFQLGPLPPMRFTFDTLNRCYPADLPPYH